MESSGKQFALFSLFLACSVSATAASIDMDDPRRALGREDGVRVDAQLLSDTVGSGSPLAVTYQIHNLTSTPVAIADKVTDVAYDRESRTITISIGSEVPSGGVMPRLTTIAPGEKKTMTAGRTLTIPVAGSGRFAAVPRFVQIKVNILRDLAPFRQLIEQQSRAGADLVLSDPLFDRWLESNDAIFLNALPVRWTPGARGMSAEAGRPGLGTF